MKLTRPLAIFVLALLVLLLLLAGVWFYPLSNRTVANQTVQALPVSSAPPPSVASTNSVPTESPSVRPAASRVNVELISTNLNQGFRQEIARLEYHQAGGPGVTPSQWKAIGDYLTIASEVSDALAKDDLTTSAALAGKLGVGLPLLRQQLGRSHPWAPLLAKVIIPATWASATNLAQARDDFMTFSAGIVEWVRVMRRAVPELASLKVYHCLVDNSPAFWFQLSPPLRNPYYGTQQLTSGAEVPD